MRPSKMLLLLSAVLLILVSCASNIATTDSPAADSTTSIEDLPPFEEYLNLADSEKFRIQMEIEDIPIASCNPYYEDLLQDFLREGPVGLRSVAIEQDNLSVIQGKNRKSLLNLILRIDLVMDTTKDINSFDIAKEIPSQVEEYLRGDTFYALKTKQRIISIYNLDGYLVWTRDSNTVIIDESIFREQPESEYAAQSVAYHYSEENPEFVLDKFGALSETKELYVEYYVEDSYFGRGEDEVNQRTDDLSQFASDIKDQLLPADPVSDYITENGLKILTIVFRNGILHDSYVVFIYEL